MAQLQKSLKSRHIFMIALGGVIGSGLFLGSGSVIQTAGPGGAILAYAAVGLVMYFTMLSLGELSVAMPDSGSFQSYATKLIHPAVGATVGWLYWLNWAVTIGIELVSIAILMQRWFPKVPSWVWCLVFGFFIFLINILSTRSFGEAEFWFSSIKVGTIILFIVLALAAIFGLLPTHSQSVGFSNLTAHGGLFPNGIWNIFVTMITVAFAFQGTEVIGVTSGESENPEKTVPKAIRQTVWRTLLFHIFSVALLVCIVPWNKLGLNQSPFVTAFDQMGIPYAADLINFVLLTAFISVANSGVYACSRMLWSMSQNGVASPIFGKLNKRGVPVPAVLFTFLFAGLSLLTSVYAKETVYNWLVSLATFAAVVVWMMIGVCQYLFRKRYIADGGRVEDLKYKTRFFPLVPIATTVLNLLVIASLWILPDQRMTIYVGVPGTLLILLIEYLRYKNKTLSAENESSQAV